MCQRCMYVVSHDVEYLVILLCILRSPLRQVGLIPIVRRCGRVPEYPSYSQTICLTNSHVRDTAYPSMCRTHEPTATSKMLQGTRGLGGSMGAGSMRRCSMVLLWLSQKVSRRLVSGMSANGAVIVHGFKYAFGSIIVSVSCRWP